MKFAVFLSGLLLLFLLPDWTESVEDDSVNINTLARIINFFEQNFKRVAAGDDYPLQYAIAINVPKDQCQQNFNLNTFLRKDRENAVEVKKAIDDDSNGLYEGQEPRELIAAGNRRVKIKKTYKIHSESLLLNPVDNSPMTNLLNKRKGDSCSVFYTFNSPCVQTCLDAKGPYNIINALKKWKEHDGIKAFVFKNFWEHDKKKDTKDLQTEFKQIAAHVPLFRCVSENECYACNGEGNTPIDADCLPPPTTTTPPEMINSEL